MGKNIKFNIIGSIIPLEILRRVNKSDYKINKHYLSINPLSYVNDAKNSSLTLPFVNKESNLSDINKTVFSEMAINKGDFVLIDLLDCRLGVNKIKFENSNDTYIATANNGLLEALKDKKHEVVENINPLELNDFDWRKILKKYVAKLLKIYRPKQIIVIDIRTASFYISKTNTLCNFGNAKDNDNLIKFYDKLYAMLKEIVPKLCYIPCPDNYYCDEEITGKPFPFTCSPEYYEYAARAVEAFVTGDKSANIANMCKECSDKSLLRVQQSEKPWKNVELKNFNGVYKDDFENFIDTGGCTLNISLRGAKNKVAIAPQCEIKGLRVILGENNTLSIGEKTRIGINCTINLGSRCLLTLDKNVLVENNASIKLVLNSVAHIGKSTELRLSFGMILKENCSLDIGENNRLLEISKLYLFNKAKLLIGNGNIISSNFFITCHSSTETIIKNNCLFSCNLSFINGDGHSIFDVETKRKINDMKTASDARRSIIINDYVWIGRGAFVLNGSNIGEGSIVGAHSLVKKAFPNNCIVAGSPAKIIKRNVCWTGNNDIEDINACKPYINMTKDLDE